MEYHFAPGSTATVEIPCFHLPGGPIVTTHGWLEGGVFPKIALAIRGSYFKYRVKMRRFFGFCFFLACFGKDQVRKSDIWKWVFLPAVYRRPPVI